MSERRSRSPEQLPDPWLFDTETLLQELDRFRELVLQIPISTPNATHFGINIAVDAIWNLQTNIRYLAHLHRRRQRSFRAAASKPLSKRQKKPLDRQAEARPANARRKA